MTSRASNMWFYLSKIMQNIVSRGLLATQRCSSLGKQAEEQTMAAVSQDLWLECIRYNLMV